MKKPYKLFGFLSKVSNLARNRFDPKVLLILILYFLQLDLVFRDWIKICFAGMSIDSQANDPEYLADHHSTWQCDRRCFGICDHFRKSWILFLLLWCFDAAIGCDLWCCGLFVWTRAIVGWNFFNWGSQITFCLINCILNYICEIIKLFSWFDGFWFMTGKCGKIS